MNEDLDFISGCAAVHPDQRGGQHVAMACPGVRATHRDTGITALVSDERSLFKNRHKATLVVRAAEAYAAYYAKPVGKRDFDEKYDLLEDILESVERLDEAREKIA